MCLEACYSNDLASQFSETFLYIGNPDVNCVHREMTHSCCVETDLRGSFFLELVVCVAWHFGRPLAFSKRWKRGKCDIGGHSYTSTKTPIKCKMFMIFHFRDIVSILGAHIWHPSSAEWQRGEEKKCQPLQCIGLTVVLSASCSLFHVLPPLGRKVI